MTSNELLILAVVLALVVPIVKLAADLRSHKDKTVVKSDAKAVVDVLLQFAPQPEREAARSAIYTLLGFGDAVPNAPLAVAPTAPVEPPKPPPLPPAPPAPPTGKAA